MSLHQSEAGPSRMPSPKQHLCVYDGCGKSYTKPAKLAQHVRSHTGERPFVCTEAGCGASYMRNEHLKAHQRQHLDPENKPFRCTQASCDMAFWTSSQLKNHIHACHTDEADLVTTHNQQTYHCTEPGCSESFHKRKNLRLHIRRSHADYTLTSEDQESTTPFICSHPGCMMRFATNAKRKLHLKIHQPNRYSCAMEHANPQDNLGAGSEGAGTSHVHVFSTWSALQAHIKAEHPRTCSWPGCAKTFNRQDGLRAHYRRHEARKLRLELELRTKEMSQESQLNYRRGSSTDDSDDSSDEDIGESGTADDAIGNYSRSVTTAVSSKSSPALPSEEELIREAAQLTHRRPKRGGIFKDLQSASQSNASRSSPSEECHTSARSGTTATRLTAAELSLPIYCSWNGCPKTYSSKGALSVHVRTAHLGDKPFECANCGRRFAHKHLVTRHRRACSEQHGTDQTLHSPLRISTMVEHEVECNDPDEHCVDIDSKTIAAEASSRSVKTRLMDLLTGSDYATVADGTLKRATDDETSARPRKRVTRDRVYHCPWDAIQLKLQADDNIDPQLYVTTDDTVAAAATTGAQQQSCEFCFKRIYDLRRHLQARHGLALEEREIRAWFQLQETTTSFSGYIHIPSQTK